MNELDIRIEVLRDRYRRVEEIVLQLAIGLNDLIITRLPGEGPNRAGAVRKLDPTVDIAQKSSTDGSCWPGKQALKSSTKKLFTSLIFTQVGLVSAVDVVQSWYRSNVAFATGGSWRSTASVYEERIGGAGGGPTLNVSA